LCQGYVEIPERKPRLYLGFGDRKHLGGRNFFVADLLTVGHSLVLPDGRKWALWQPLCAELTKRAIGSH
jgi:hypothetical protein